MCRGGHCAAMAIDLTGADDEREDQAGHHPDPDQHSMPETADRAPDSEPATPTALPAAGGFSTASGPYFHPPLDCQWAIRPPLDCQWAIRPPLDCQWAIRPPLDCQWAIRPPLDCQWAIRPTVLDRHTSTPKELFRIYMDGSVLEATKDPYIDITTILDYYYVDYYYY